MSEMCTSASSMLRTAALLLSASLWACGGGGGTDAAVDSSVVDGGGSDAADGAVGCVSDTECDDGVFCNGVELCAPEDPRADAQGCRPAEADACVEGQTCDEDIARCQTLCDVTGDADGDGHDSIDCGGDDCDDADNDRFPGNSEICDAAGHDEDCDPSSLGADGDGDGDGHLRITCCNPQTDGSSLCGDDCDDAKMDVHPGALEVCDSGVDNDCNGVADADDGVCVPCAAGYRGFDGSCTNVDECADLAPCGSADGIGCIDTDGSYTCTCPAGYTGAGPGAGGSCVDNNECTASPPCGALATACDNLPGTYSCTCAPGYSAPATGGTCSDVDECATASTCGTASTGCTNTIGSYACACTAGYTAPAVGGTCMDIDECATASTCGTARAGCTNRLGSYTCSCSSGYAAPATAGTCTNVDECLASTDDCDSDPSAACADTTGSFTCTCPAGPWVGTGHGAAGCQLTDAYLSDLSPSTGGFDVAFSRATLSYTLTLPPATSNFRLTPTTSYPTHATIRVDGAVVASGAASPLISLAAELVMQVPVTVTTDHGETLTYMVTAVRSSAYIKESNTDASDNFGAVALSDDGLTMAIGAQGESSRATGVGGDQINNSRPNAGAVYVFTRSGSTWSQQAYIKASNTGFRARFGSQVALSADGSTLAVTARSENSGATGIGGNQADHTAMDAGAVYLFTRAGTTWSQQAYIKASNTEEYDYFGSALALSDDGSMLAVGALGEDSGANGIDGNQADNSAPAAGAVYVFTRSGTVWSQQAYIKASNSEGPTAGGGGGDTFGSIVSLSSDGSMLAVGAPGEDSNSTGVGGAEGDNTARDAGAVYVFTRSGTVWSQQAYIKASNTDAGDSFGSYVALSSDGLTLAVGAQLEDSNATGIDGSQANDLAPNSGALYVFTRAGGTWSQQAYIKASNANSGDRFGSVALTADGNALLVGAVDEASNATGIDGGQSDNGATRAGAAYLFHRSGTTWSQAVYLKASNTDASDRFGSGVALSADGSVLVMGAQDEASNATGVDGNQASNSATYAGAVYVF